MKQKSEWTPRQIDRLHTILRKLEGLQLDIPPGRAADDLSDAKAALLSALRQVDND